MPQEFVVLKCKKCLMFQVHQSKKATKWKCKVCNENQTINRFFGKGNGKECRQMVQKFNSSNFTDDQEYIKVLEQENIQTNSQQTKTNHCDDEDAECVPLPKKCKVSHDEDAIIC